MIGITRAAVAQNCPTTLHRIGIVLSALAAVALFADGAAQLFALPNFVSAAAEIGYPESLAFWRGIGALLLVSTLLYALPRTSFFGALLIRGFLGGAIASHVRVGNDALVPVLAALVLATIAWGGLWCRDPHRQAPVRGRGNRRDESQGNERF